MPRSILYDFSRLATRVLNNTPNGIDRLDDLLAGHFLAQPQTTPLIFGLGGPRLRAPDKARQTLARVRAGWGETPSNGTERTYARVAAALLGTSAERGLIDVAARTSGRAARLRAGLKSLRTFGLFGGTSVLSAPQSAVFLNATHFPIEWSSHVRWLTQRPDVRPVFFIHDVLPITHPELFWGREPQAHRKRLQVLADRGAGAIVTSTAVAEVLRALLADLGRTDLSIFQAPPPVSSVFLRRVAPDPALERVAYFVACGTIEPRKNYGLLATVWKELVHRHGAAAPKLLIVGKRGWRYDTTVQALHDPALRGHVIEVNGLSTPAYRRLLAGARALLAPSKDEGFGLTLREAMCAGIPVIASDIPSHREQAGEFITMCKLNSLANWVVAIEAFAAPDSPERRESLGRIRAYQPTSASDYLAQIDDFLQRV